jgi:TRAP transporter TAXI family solute receptor
MNKKIIFGRSLKDILVSAGPAFLLLIVVLFVAYKYVSPAPPNHLVIATGDNEGDYQTYAKDYQRILKRDGIKLEIRPSKGPLENLQLLENDEANVDVGFVQDGLGSPAEQPDVVSLGSLYYEPLWVFYNGKSELTRLSQLLGKKVAIGRQGRGTQLIAMDVLKESGINAANTHLLEIGLEDSAEALKKGEIDAAFFLATPEDALIEELALTPTLHLMSFDQGEAISRQLPYLHHIILPHGVFDLHRNIPNKDVDLVAPTATLLVRDDLHPALIFLLLKAAKEIHNQPGILEKRDEFPINKDDQFPLSDEALQFYKSGGPFWQRYLPFWLAAWVDRFLLLVIPLLALIIPMVKMVPRVYQWRIRSRIFQRYGELKFLETQIKNPADLSETAEFLKKLDAIEDRVNKMKVPLDYSEHIYSLRGHIHFVRERLQL